MKKNSALTRKSFYSLFIGFLVVSVFLLTFSANVEAMSSSASLPVYIAPDETYNLDYFAQVFARRYPNGSSGVTANNFYSADNSLIYVGNQWNGGIDIFVVLFDSSSVYEFSLPVNYDIFDINNYSLTFKYRNVIFLDFRQYTGYDWNVASIGNHSNPNSFTSVNFSSSFLPLYIGGNYYYNNDSSLPVFTNVEPIVIPDVGHAQNPNNNLPTISYPIGMHSTSAPTVPTYTSPTISTAPSIDTTSINTLLQSIFDLLAWMLQSIVVYLANFIDTFVDWLEFLGNLVVWLFKSYIDWLNAFTDWLYNIFKYLFEPIFSFLSSFFNFLFNVDDQMSIYDLLKQFKEEFSSRMSNLFSASFFSDYWNYFSSRLNTVLQIFDDVLLFFNKIIDLGTVNNEFTISNLLHALFIPSSSDVVTALRGHDDFGFFDCGHAVKQVSNSIYTDFSSITPAKTFHVPGLFYHGVLIGNFDIDFSWYDNFKTYGDGIITVFLTISWVYWVILNLSNWLRGSASVGSDVSRLEK